ncbi:hypothetical protein M422DRAFT_780862 [Sphaerobolus stellatus SS14]|uniref:Unplaced genomic scaffold SPHSTscaffold_72, whole genome shotgun sequence n=1 Tax=Sphaerobolus stellatus (strain SS14) TaxID=990650 RepID=A0A0C9UYU6_SPHS4|nr:hypothetical protein M422DRAFT_780862 [Sphaerobolus stellatus SS14]
MSEPRFDRNQRLSWCIKGAALATGQDNIYFSRNTHTSSKMGHHANSKLAATYYFLEIRLLVTMQLSLAHKAYQGEYVNANGDVVSQVNFRFHKSSQSGIYSCNATLGAGSDAVSYHHRECIVSGNTITWTIPGTAIITPSRWNGHFGASDDVITGTWTAVNPLLSAYPSFPPEAHGTFQTLIF